MAPAGTELPTSTIPEEDEEKLLNEDENENAEDGDEEQEEEDRKLSTARLALVSIIAGGVQFGWALQLSLLTPYVQELGIPHAYASFIWLCGPISGLLVQPMIGVWTDSCTSKWGPRRPFIFVGTILITISMLIIGYSADIGYQLGDREAFIKTGAKPYACLVFVIGFWMLDLANNTLQGPCRALVADLASESQRNAGNAFFSMWMAVGNVLGYSTGASGMASRLLPRAIIFSPACSGPCANLKSAFLLALLFLLVCSTITMLSAPEQQLVLEDEEEEEDWLSKVQMPLLDEDRPRRPLYEPPALTGRKSSLKADLAASADGDDKKRKRVTIDQAGSDVPDAGALGMPRSRSAPRVDLPDQLPAPSTGRRFSVDAQTPLLASQSSLRSPGYKRARRSDLLYRIGSGGPEFYGSMDYLTHHRRQPSLSRQDSSRQEAIIAVLQRSKPPPPAVEQPEEEKTVLGMALDGAAQVAEVTGEAIASAAQATGEAITTAATATGEAITTAAVVTSNAVTKAAKATKKKVTRGCSRVFAPLVQIFKEINMGLWSLSVQMKLVMVVMAFTWLAWFPFFLFDTDWVGREVYHGAPRGESPAAATLYQLGVRTGALGLLLNSIVQGITSLLIDPLCTKFGSKWVWAGGNVIMAACLGSSYVISHAAYLSPHVGPHGEILLPSDSVRYAAVAMFALLGIPLAITYSVPYSLTAVLTAHDDNSSGGQGLAMGVLNLAIVVPQVVISVGSGPWDALFGGGNVPAFVTAAVFAFIGAVCAGVFLPRKLLVNSGSEGGGDEDSKEEVAI
ncbi:sucrose transporter [Klebsormidium nitens]|uniref:Sucrose transporter n=1 Tax=Klebsormidium nitens TaxID=105231 RepID=A0A1Y1HQ78_KLENI|nr:sucrose transporter [Klebsormidium nitens]|eukprot:GAQ79141.1 sucrose transporter [Klebsormidium nitens]